MLPGATAASNGHRSPLTHRRSFAYAIPAPGPMTYRVENSRIRTANCGLAAHSRRSRVKAVSHITAVTILRQNKMGR